MQGIRIRLGRSMVTLLGVVLGIAFLMSILTGEVIKGGVAKETALRADLGRMESFLTAETGPLEGRDIAVWCAGEPDEKERRLVVNLARECGHPIALSGHDAGFPASVARHPVELSKAADNAVAIILVGDGAAPSADELGNAISIAHQKVVATTRGTFAIGALPEGASQVALERELREDERLALEKEAAKSRFRTGWITVISLLVTVIGISNAMLMSVTERFREIGTMKCLGALSSFIRTMFFLEASLLGVIGSAVGGLFGFLFSLVAYSFTFGGGLVIAALNPAMLLLYFLMSLVAGVVLSILAAIYPARFASRMVPATALRSTI